MGPEPDLPGRSLLQEGCWAFPSSEGGSCSNTHGQEAPSCPVDVDAQPTCAVKGCGWAALCRPVFRVMRQFSSLSSMSLHAGGRLPKT